MKFKPETEASSRPWLSSQMARFGNVLLCSTLLATMLAAAPVTTSPAMAAAQSPEDRHDPNEILGGGIDLRAQLTKDGEEATGESGQDEPLDEDGATEDGTPEDGTSEDAASEDAAPQSSEGVNALDAEIAKPQQIVDDVPLPEIQRDFDKLPFPAKRMRELLLEAAKSGDIEKLRPFIGEGDDMTMLSLTSIEEDPIEYLKAASGDGKGYETLAILSEVLEAGYVVVDEGTERETYVWPYFFAWPIDKLDPAQSVELYRLITFGDYEDMKTFGAYIFYRVGITPEGRWRFFVAGD